MTEIAAFRGILYTKKAGAPDKLLAPPYDVISDEERARLAALDPHNCVRLILPEGVGDEKYQNAARDLNERRPGAIETVAVPGLCTGTGMKPPAVAARQMRDACEAVQARG